MSIRIAATSATGVVVIAAVFAYVVLSSGGQPANEPLPPLPNGWTAVQAEGEPAVSRDEAVAIANDRHTRYAEGASDTVARFLRVSSKYRTYMLDDTPVWIVTYGDIELYLHGMGTGKQITDFNIVIDARTGEAITRYAVASESTVQNGAN